MKQILTLLALNLVALALVATASYMAINDLWGWGWFLLCAMCATHVAKGSINN